jgi:hypothetical protein
MEKHAKHKTKAGTFANDSYLRLAPRSAERYIAYAKDYYTALRKETNPSKAIDDRISTLFVEGKELELWKEVTILWVEHAKSTGDAASKESLQGQIRSADREACRHIYQDLMQAHVAEFPKAVVSSFSTDDWLRLASGKPYEDLRKKLLRLNPIMYSPKPGVTPTLGTTTNPVPTEADIMPKAELWLLNEVRYRIWLESMGIERTIPLRDEPKGPPEQPRDNGTGKPPVINLGGTLPPLAMPS